MTRGRRPPPIEVGYLRASQALDRLFSICFSLGLLIVASPLIALISLIIAAVDGTPIFHSGLRLGKDKRLFRMYKFRTLIAEAQDLIGGEVFTAQLSSNRGLLTRTGSFLRETRLDELPQLLNVLRGDMDVLGPRPERPEVYEKLCRGIPGYDRRFSVKPGLIGYSQVFTPHSSPKRIRHLVDSKFLNLRHLYTLEIVVVNAALLLLSLRLVWMLYAVLRGKLAGLLRGQAERRALPRIMPRSTLVRFGPGGEPPAGALDGEGVLGDINEEALLMHTAAEVGDGPLTLRISVPVVNWHGRPQLKTAYCSGRKLHESALAPEPFRHSYVIRYAPLSPFNGYVVHQYLLDGSIARIGRGRRPLRS